MTTTVRWVIVAVAVLALVSLLIWARGFGHHHGDEEDKAAAVAAAGR